MILPRQVLTGQANWMKIKTTCTNGKKGLLSEQTILEKSLCKWFMYRRCIQGRNEWQQKFEMLVNYLAIIFILYGFTANCVVAVYTFNALWCIINFILIVGHNDKSIGSHTDLPAYHIYIVGQMYFVLVFQPGLTSNSKKISA